MALHYDAVADSLATIPDYTKAILFRKKALNIYQNARPVPFEKVASGFRAIGTYYRRAGNYKDCEQYLKRSLEVASQRLPADHTELAKGYNSYGIFKLTMGEFDKAIELLSKSMAINQRKGYPDLANNFNNLGICHERKGEYEKALEFYGRALLLNRTKNGTFHISTADNFINLGTSYQQLADYDNAVAHYDTALLIYDSILPANHIEFAGIFNNLGAVHSTRGDYRSAVAFLNKALEINEINKGLNHPDVASIYANIGNLLLKRGDFNRALAYFQNAYDIRLYHFGKKNLLVARTANYLGDCYLQKNEFSKAYDWFNQSLSTYLSLPDGDPADLADYKNDLGWYFEKLGNTKEALRYYSEALNVVRKSSREDLDIANSYERIGNVLLATGDNEAAAYYFREALLIEKKLLGGHNPEVGRLYSLLALACANDETCALEYCDSAFLAVNYRWGEINSFQAVSSPLALLDILMAKGRIQQGFHQLAPAKKWLQAADATFGACLDLIDFIKNSFEEPGSRQELLGKYFQIYEDAISVKFQLKAETNDPKFWHEAFNITERSNATLLVEALQAVDAERFTGIPDSLLQKEHNLKISLAFLEKQLYEERLRAGGSDPKLLQKLSGKIFNLQKQYERLNQAIKQDYPVYFELKYTGHTIGVAEIQGSLLMEGQCMLSYFVGEKNVYAFVVGQDRFEVVEIPKEFPLEIWVEEFRSSIYRYNPASGEAAFLSQKYANLGHELYSLIFEPVQPLLGTRNIVIVPGGTLGYLPFDALLSSAPESYSDFDNHHYLIRDYQFSYAYSATLLKEMREGSTNWRRGGFLAFAPTYAGDSLNLRSDDPWRAVLGRLKYNVAEVENIQSIMGGEIRTGEDATEANFLSLAPKAGILHLAVHAKSNDEHGEYSYLAFFQTVDSVENELVFVKDLYNMRIRAALVVLSACETGIGELQRGEGIISLARGFSYAGAASIVTTLWSIDDNASAEIMLLFYEKLRAGATKDEALRSAKLTFLENRQGSNASHPLYWAAFMPVGDMSPLSDRLVPFWAWLLAGALGVGLAVSIWKSRNWNKQTHQSHGS